MKLATFGARLLTGIAATALLAACSDAPDEDHAAQVVEEFATLSSADMKPSVAFSELTWQIFNQLASQSMLSPEEMAGWTDEAEVRAEIDRRYAGYAADIDQAILAEIRAGLSEEQVAALDAIDDDPAKLDAARCSANSQALDWPAKWAGCEAQGSTPLSAEEKATYEAFVGALNSAMGSDAALAYWGGTTCALLTDFAEDVSTANLQFAFNDIELHLGDSPSRPCGELTAMLDDVRSGGGE